MRVLFVSARFPYPPDRGDRLTAYHLLHALSRRHRVTLVSFRDGHEPEDAGSPVAALCERVETVSLSRARSWSQAWLGLLSTTPSQVSYYRSPTMRRLVRRLCAETRFDAIFVQLFRMEPFVRDIPHPAKVLFLGDSLALGLLRSMPYRPWWKRPGLEWERLRVAAFEAGATRGFRESWVLSDVDRADLEARGGRDLVRLAHGVDERLFDLSIAPRMQPRAMFLGNLSVPHNVDAACFLAREIWPLVRTEVPAAELQLVGADPAPAVRELGATAGVTVTGRVPDLLPFWQATAVLVAPLRFSSGIQNKVLEAMAAGVPVVATPQVAEGIGAVDAAVLRTGRDARELAAATVELLRDPAGASPMVERARAFVRQRFSWDAMVQRLEQVAAVASNAP